MKFTILSAILFAALGYSEAEVLLQTDFNQLPSGWVNDEDWVFGSFGAALCVSIQDTTWSGEFSTEGEPPVRYFVPEGTDSVVVDINHWVLLSAGEVKSEASSSAMIQLWTSQSGWGDYIYYNTISDSFFTQEMTSSYVLDNVLPDTFLGFRFTGELVSGSQDNYAEVIWQVNEMTVTAYGVMTALDSGTWGSIKARF